MHLKCAIGIHDWAGCKCSKCAKTRAVGHDWTADCEKCAKCGTPQIGAHDWTGCRCSKCGKVRDKAHDWNGCKCNTCGTTRDKGHDWSGCKCTTCGTTRDEGHDWSGCKCTKCEKTRDDEHEWRVGICLHCHKEGFGPDRDFLEAVTESHFRNVERAFARGANANARYAKGDTALMAATSSQNQDMVRWLCENGADIDEQSLDDGWTALHWAVIWGSDETIAVTRVLLEMGADPTVTCWGGRTPLERAKAHYKETIALLKSNPDGTRRLNDSVNRQQLAAKRQLSKARRAGRLAVKKGQAQLLGGNEVSCSSVLACLKDIAGSQSSTSQLTTLCQLVSLGTTCVNPLKEIVVEEKDFFLKRLAIWCGGALNDAGFAYFLQNRFFEAGQGIPNRDEYEMKGLRRASLDVLNGGGWVP